MAMISRNEVIEYCMTFPGAYEDYPFEDFNWTVMRRKDTCRGFCWIFEREGRIWINIKADPGWAEFWRGNYASIRPGYHMNKKHWISIILDGTVPDEMTEGMIGESYDLCGPKRKRV